MRDYASLPTAILAETASQDLKVVFSGEGGDEGFGGYGRYHSTPSERWIKDLLSPGSGGFRTRGQWSRRWFGRLAGPALRDARDAFRTPIIQAYRDAPADWSALQRFQFIDLTTALPDNLLVKADRMLMASGLEGRVPFVDHRIVEFGLSLPDGLKYRAHHGKALLKRWAERFLPKDHLYRKKRGFHVPVREWLAGPFLDRLEGRLLEHRAVKEWFQVDALRQAFAAQRQGGARVDLSREIFSIMQFAIWYGLFVEPSGRVPGRREDPLDWLD
jgi:asparagine synthase (glutamine-hydrolysing)